MTTKSTDHQTQLTLKRKVDVTNDLAKGMTQHDVIESLFTYNC